MHLEDFILGRGGWEDRVEDKALGGFGIGDLQGGDILELHALIAASLDLRGGHGSTSGEHSYLALHILQLVV